MGESRPTPTGWIEVPATPPKKRMGVVKTTLAVIAGCALGILVIRLMG